MLVVAVAGVGPVAAVLAAALPSADFSAGLSDAGAGRGIGAPSVHKSAISGRRGSGVGRTTASRTKVTPSDMVACARILQAGTAEPPKPAAAGNGGMVSLFAWASVRAAIYVSTISGVVLGIASRTLRLAVIGLIPGWRE